MPNLDPQHKELLDAISFAMSSAGDAHAITWISAYLVAWVARECGGRPFVVLGPDGSSVLITPPSAL